MRVTRATLLGGERVPVADMLKSVREEEAPIVVAAIQRLADTKVLRWVPGEDRLVVSPRVIGLEGRAR